MPKPTPRMLELRGRMHRLLAEYADVVNDYVDYAAEETGEDPADQSRPQEPILDSWVMLVRWADLDPEDPDADGWLTVLHSGCSETTRIGLAVQLADMLRS